MDVELLYAALVAIFGAHLTREDLGRAAAIAVMRDPRTLSGCQRVDLAQTLCRGLAQRLVKTQGLRESIRIERCVWEFCQTTLLVYGITEVKDCPELGDP